MNNEKVSIITATYNAVRFIDCTVRSIIVQTYTDWELLITDDCSTDDTWQHLQQLAQSDSRIRIFRLDENSGAGVARNRSITEATGRYIAFCDSDDYWAPNKLECQLTAMHEANIEMSHTSYHVVDEHDHTIGHVKCDSRITFDDILHDNGIGMLTLMYDTQRIGKVMMPTIRRRQDWGMNMLLLQHIEASYGIDTPLAYYRRVSGSLSSRKTSLVKYNIAIYEQVLGYSWLRARYHFYCRFMPSYLIKRAHRALFHQ